MAPTTSALLEYTKTTDRTAKQKNATREIDTDRGLPETTNYPDTGCELAPSCLECPLALCKYDDPNISRRSDSNKVMRDAEIMRLFKNGLDVIAIARQVNTSDRTVYRIIQRKIGTAARRKQTLRNKRGHTSRKRNHVNRIAHWNQYHIPNLPDARAA